MFIDALAVAEVASVVVLVQDLADDLSSELSGNFRSVVLGLLMLATVYDCHELRNAIKVPMSSLYKIPNSEFCFFFRLCENPSEVHFSALWSSFKLRFYRDCVVCATVWEPLTWTVDPPVFAPGSWDRRSLSHRYSRLKDEWWNQSHQRILQEAWVESGRE